MENEEPSIQTKPIKFSDFKQYCQKIVPILNDPEIVQKQNKLSLKGTFKEIISYRASYKIMSRKFAKQHDCEYLEIEQIFRTWSEDQKYQKKVLLKINITYSIAYQIPLLLFMPYHIEVGQKQQSRSEKGSENENSQIQAPKPFKKQEIHSILNYHIGSQKLEPQKEQTGVFIIQNPINKQYFYSLHHCHMKNQGMGVKELIPYYLGMLNIHPELIL